MSFLLGCANPLGGHVDTVILDGEPELEHDEVVPPKLESPTPSADIQDTIDPRLLFLGYLDAPFEYASEYEGMNLMKGQNRLELQISDDQFEGRIGILATSLIQVATSVPELRSVLNMDLFSAFFRPANFLVCIAAFFYRGHLLASIIHFPTFRLDHVDMTLLLAIALSGSIYLHHRKESPPPDVFTLALQGVAEKYIFDRVDQSISIANTSSDSRGEILELCQAAYLIETLQMFVKDSIVRQRLVSKRHPSLVAFLRHINVMGLQHEAPQSNWHLFVCRESWVRLVTWTFINDAWLVLFSNHPPAMTLDDMRGELPFGDELWHADDIASFNLLINERGFSASPCLRDLVMGLLNDEWTECTSTQFKHLDVRHLHVVILG